MSSLQRSASQVHASKRKYGSRKEAARAASGLRKLIARSTGFSEPIKPYHCDICHAWHVGHPIGWHAETGISRPAIRTTLNARV